MLLNRKVQQIVADNFDFVATDDVDAEQPIGAFRADDQEDFIV
jgi:hypothetical protein